MLGFVNVLEEILVKETYNQIDDLRPELQSKAKVKVAEVLAYALNRLPPLFVTSPSGWHHQSNYATSDLQPQISQLVKQGLKNALLGDPIHDLTPLPNHLFSNSAGVLHQLSKIFGRSHIRWRDVPALVESIISRSVINKIFDETIIQSDDATVIQGGADNLSRYTLGLVYGSKRFREKLATQQREQESNLQESHQTWTWEMKERDMAEMEYRALQAYTLQARLGMINVLEHLVFRAMEKIMKPELHQRINRAEVAAYALNRLPPMYATSDRGFKHLRQRAINEFARELVVNVRIGAVKVLYASSTDSTPTYSYKFEKEYEQSMQALRKLLNREDIGLNNIVPIMQNLLLRQSK